MNVSLAQQEFCAHDVHDWKYITPTERVCKCCKVRHIYALETEWVKAICQSPSTEN